MPITMVICNFKRFSLNLNIDDFKSKPPDCTSASSKFTNNPAGHVFTGDFNIVNNSYQRYQDYNLVRAFRLHKNHQ